MERNERKGEVTQDDLGATGRDTTRGVRERPANKRSSAAEQ